MKKSKKQSASLKKNIALAQEVARLNNDTGDILKQLAKENPTKLHPWNPSDGVIFDTNSSSCSVPDIAEPTELEEFGPAVSAVIRLPFTEANKVNAPTGKERHIWAQTIRARHGDTSAQNELISRFGPMTSDWSRPLPVEPRMNLWQRILFVFRGYND
jgi:hypothetical protein